MKPVSGSFARSLAWDTAASGRYIARVSVQGSERGRAEMGGRVEGGRTRGNAGVANGRERKGGGKKRGRERASRQRACERAREREKERGRGLGERVARRAGTGERVWSVLR